MGKIKILRSVSKYDNGDVRKRLMSFDIEEEELEKFRSKIKNSDEHIKSVCFVYEQKE